MTKIRESANGEEFQNIPRLFLFSGIWHCKSDMSCGIGYTPKQAYADWHELMLDRMFA